MATLGAITFAALLRSSCEAAAIDIREPCSTFPSSPWQDSQQVRRDEGVFLAPRTDYNYNLPLAPETTPAILVGGLILLAAGTTLAFVGVKSPGTHLSISSALLASLAATVLVAHLTDVPVSHAIQGAYLVAIIAAGASLAAVAQLAKDSAVRVSCLLGGLCLGMWILTLRAGGTIQNATGRAVFVPALGAVVWSLSYSRHTRDHVLIASTSFAGATACILGVDCFSKAGLKEFWLYLWAVNDELFPVLTVTYPVTKWVLIETVLIPVITILGVVSQARVCGMFESRMNRLTTAQQEEDLRLDGVGERLNGSSEHDNRRARAEWGRTYNILSGSEQARRAVPQEHMKKNVSKVTMREFGSGEMYGSQESDTQGQAIQRLPIGFQQTRQYAIYSKTDPVFQQSDKLIGGCQAIHPGSSPAGSSRHLDRQRVGASNSGHQLSERASMFENLEDEDIRDVPSSTMSTTDRKRISSHDDHDKPSDVSSSLSVTVQEVEHDPEVLIRNKSRTQSEVGSKSRGPSLDFTSGITDNKEQERSYPGIANASTFRDAVTITPYTHRSLGAAEKPPRPHITTDEAPSLSGSIKTDSRRTFSSTGRHLQGLTRKIRPTSSESRKLAQKYRTSSTGFLTQSLVDSPIDENSMSEFSTPTQLLHARSPYAQSLIRNNAEVPQQDGLRSMSSPLPRSSSSNSTRSIRMVPLRPPTHTISNESSSSSSFRSSLTSNSFGRDSASSRTSTTPSSNPYRRPSQSTPFDPPNAVEKDATLAQLRATLRHHSAPNLLPKPASDLRRDQMIRETQQARMSAQQEKANQWYRDYAFENAMRRSDMQALHREAMRKMQAQANRHASLTRIEMTDT